MKLRNQRRQLGPLLLLLLQLSCSFTASATRQIQLQSDGRYGNVLVAILDAGTEDWQLIDRIKAAFSSASSQLSLATQFHKPSSFAFGDVRILIPKSWNSSRADAVATWEKQDAASFRVGSSGSKIPFTVQPAGCGEQGLYVNLHSQHLNETDAYWMGKQLVHEFGHLRWGLFNEFNDEDGPHHYLANRRIYPVTCSRGVQGRFVVPQTGAACRIDRNSLQPEPACRFVPNEQQQAEASLLYATYIRAVDQFCSKSSDPNLDHNADAPNPHNRLCKRRSARYIMEKHPDFRRQLNVTETDTAVKFTVLSPAQDRRLAIVMDVSGSMQGQPLAKLKIAGRTLVMNQLEDGIECGLISFNAKPQELLKLQALDSKDVRRQYYNVIKKLRAGGGTAIGSALVSAMEMLGANVNQLSKNDTGYILLLTDGQENVLTPYSFDQAARMLNRTSIVVDTIAFGNAADKRLQALSRDTGGKAYFVTFKTAANDLIEAMADLVRDRVSSDQKPIDIFSSPVRRGFSQQVEVDESVAKSLSVQLSSTEVTDIKNTDLQLKFPSGKIIDKNDKENYEKDVDTGLITITSDEAEVGKYTISDQTTVRRRRSSQKQRSPVSNTMSLTISSKPSQAAPIILDGSLSHEKILLNQDTQLAVYATLTQGAQLITNASISASVESDEGIMAEFQLRDDGVGADARAHDGVFTGLVPLSVQKRQEYNVRLLCQHPVDRVSTAGKFEITGIDQGSIRQIPPSAIADLRSEINLQQENVTLLWTAVGDQRMDGKASLYIMRICKTIDDIDNSTADCQNLNLDAPPQEAGQQMQASLTLQQLGDSRDTLYIGVMAQNKLKVRSDVSNVVSVQLTLPENVEEIENAAGGLHASMPTSLTSVALSCVVMATVAVLRL